MKKLITVSVLIMIFAYITLPAQPGTIELMNAINKVNANVDALSHNFDILQKQIDDVQDRKSVV